MLRPDTLALTALLALLTAVGPMSVDLYLPSLPELGRVFGASVPQVQLTLSGYLLCFAIGQIVFGPISDHVGRKPVLLAALSLYVAVCLSCLFATSIEMLIALRCLQALGVAGAPVLARAIVRDLYQGVRAGRELARMGSGARAGRGALARRRPAGDIRLARKLPRHGRARPLRDHIGGTA